MNFSASIFALEVNHKPIFAFEAKWASDAETFGFNWAQDHADRLITKGSHGTDLPAVVKVRIARPTEKATYLGADAPTYYQDVKIVYLSDPGFQ